MAKWVLRNWWEIVKRYYWESFFVNNKQVGNRKWDWGVDVMFVNGEEGEVENRWVGALI